MNLFPQFKHGLLLFLIFSVFFFSPLYHSLVSLACMCLLEQQSIAQKRRLKGIQIQTGNLDMLELKQKLLTVLIQKDFARTNLLAEVI